MEYVNLGDIVEIYLGITHTPEYVNEGVPFLSVKDISKGIIDFSNCKYISIEEFNSFPKGAKPQKGDILFCRVGTIGKPIIISEDIPEFGSFVSLGYLRLKSNDWNPEFIKYWMESDLFWKQVKQNTKGASQVNLNTTWLKKFTIPHYNIEKQNKIVKELNKIANLICKNKINIENFDKIVKSQFIEMFGDPILNEKWWNKEIISRHINVQGGYAFKSNEFIEEGVPVLRIGNINSGKFKSSNLVYWCKDSKLKNYEVYPGDLVLSLTGTAGKDDYGNICVMDNSFDLYYLNQRNAKLIINNSYNSYFLKELFSNREIKNILIGSNHGVRQGNILNKDILNLYAIVPPIELQNKFADFVQQIDKSKFIIQKQIKLLEELLEKKMNEYFGGE